MKGERLPPLPPGWVPMIPPLPALELLRRHVIELRSLIDGADPDCERARLFLAHVQSAIVEEQDTIDEARRARDGRPSKDPAA